MPHLQDLLEQHKQASQNFARTEQGVKDAQQAEATATKHAQARNEIDLLDKHIENLRTALNKKNISLGEKMKAESALEKAKNSRSIRRVVLTAGIGFQGMHKLGSLLSLSNGEP
jgi:valyl-tRNA synthetase